MLPDGLFDLGKLKQLSLGSNQISEVPENILKLENLKVLDFSNNQIETSPYKVSDQNKFTFWSFVGNKFPGVVGHEVSTITYVDGVKIMKPGRGKSF